MKQFLLLSLAFSFAISSFAQKAKIDKAKWDGDKLPCATITVKGDRKTVMKNLKDVLKDEDLKVKGNAKKLQAPAVNWKRVSENLMNVYATSEKESSDKTTVNVFLATGSDKSTFIGEGNEMKELTEFLEDEFVDHNDKVLKKIAEKKKKEEAKKREKDIKKQEKKIKKLNKKLEQDKALQLQQQ